ncbi:helix-turn-helix domain-containing protein [Aequorivita marina]|uniref:helix-turn-helix domain-containing protein n=1 Tax=Aequorivita marina TaxID=3073654 RepID=UPI002874647B|nr:helix-turn-helix transcriptional regulator [Aequorivita sp. S2608]MDS1299153.1 helix-turn-helix transcriptional regulator [Aequorivita sp. S2608]
MDQSSFKVYTEKAIQEFLDNEDVYQLSPPFFLLVKEGEVKLKSNELYVAKESSLSVSAKQEPVNIVEVSSACQLLLLEYDRQEIRKMSFQLNLIDVFKYVYTNTRFSFTLLKNDFEDLWFLAGYIARQFQDHQNINLSNQILRHLNYSFLYSAIDKLDHSNQLASQPTTQKEKLALHFFQNLQTKGDFRLKVSDYAKMQSVTTRHLSATIKQLTGMTAQEIIHRLLLSKAKKELSGSLMPVSEVALELGFIDPYTFSHFFKRNTGMSPSEFRKNYQD